MTEFLLPELGENVAGGDVLRVLVKPGDHVERDQPVVELETDKATIEVPSSVVGRVTQVHVREGQKIAVGEVVLTVEGNHASAALEATAAAGHEEAAESSEVVAAVRDDDVGDDADGPVVESPPAPSPVAAGPIEFTLPSLGENIAGGDVLRVLVKVGDGVQRDQALLELETDKATIEVPSSLAGRISEVRVKEGERIQVGDVVFVIEAEGGSAVAPPSITVQRVHAAGPSTAEPAAALEAPTIREDKPGMLEDALEEARAEAALRTGPGARGEVVAMPHREESPKRLAPAAPSVRRVARELGVDISQVPGSGPGGRISAEDVRRYVKKVMSSGGPRAMATATAPALSPVALPDFAKWGPVERKPMRAVRRKTAEHLSQAWSLVPHVTQADKADITAIEELRVRYGKRVEAAGGKLTVTAIALKVVAAAMRQFPQFNAAVDMAAEAIVYRQYVNIGVAVDTDRGLIVPVIRDVDRKNIVQLSAELADAAERARTGKTTLDEMQGGGFTITNLGGLGGTYFTPIVNYPEVAILGLSRAQMEPVWKDGAFVPRLMLPLSLSYDHRVIDGADGIRFLRWVAEALEQPFLLALQG